MQITQGNQNSLIHRFRQLCGALENSFLISDWLLFSPAGKLRYCLYLGNISFRIGGQKLDYDPICQPFTPRGQK